MFPAFSGGSDGPPPPFREPPPPTAPRSGSAPSDRSHRTLVLRAQTFPNRPIQRPGATSQALRPPDGAPPGRSLGHRPLFHRHLPPRLSGPGGGTAHQPAGDAADPGRLHG